MQDKEAVLFALATCNTMQEADLAMRAFMAGYKQCLEDVRAEAERLERYERVDL